MTGDIAAAIGALSGIKTIAGGLVALRDEAKVLEVKVALLEKVFEINSTLLSLQGELAALKQENRDLQDENRGLKKRADQAGDNELFEVIPGVYVYAAKPAEGARHKPPYFCQACYGEGKKTALSFVPPYFDFDPGSLRCSAEPNHSTETANSITAQSLGYGS